MDNTPNLGPYSDVEAFIVGDGYAAINHLLATGWRILQVHFVLDERGPRGTEAYRKQYIPYAAMGRAIEGGEMADRVRADAIAYSDAQTQTAGLREDELLADVPALIDEPEDESPETQARSRVLNDAQEKRDDEAPPIRRRKPQSIAETAAASVRE